MTIARIMEMLNQNSAETVQKRGRALAGKMQELHMLIQPEGYGNKAVWENCALVLVRKSDEELRPYLPELLRWLQDINWPGALTILDRLRAFNGEFLQEPLKNAVREAEALPHQEGMTWLDYLSELLDNKTATDCLDAATRKLLEIHYHNWAYWEV